MKIVGNEISVEDKPFCFLFIWWGVDGETQKRWKIKEILTIMQSIRRLEVKQYKKGETG